MKITKNDFVMHISDKDFAKIRIHLEVHGLGKTKAELVHESQEWINYEVPFIAIISFYPKSGMFLLTTAVDNIPTMKEIVYHWMNCSCKIDEVVDSTSTWKEALQKLGIWGGSK